MDVKCPLGVRLRLRNFVFEFRHGVADTLDLFTLHQKRSLTKFSLVVCCVRRCTSPKTNCYSPLSFSSPPTRNKGVLDRAIDSSHRRGGEMPCLSSSGQDFQALRQRGLIT